MKNKPTGILAHITSLLSLHRFKIPRIPIFVAAAGLAVSAMATSTLPFYEPFPAAYGENENLGLAGSSGVLWDFGNSVSSSCGRITAAAAQMYPGMLTDTSASKGLRSNPTGSGTKNRGASLTIPTNTTVYASVLLKVVSTNLNNRPFFGFSTATSGSGVSLNGAVIYLDQNLMLSLAKNSSTPDATVTYGPLTTNTTYLLVLRYKFNSGSSSDDSVDLWVNPNSSLGVADANIPPPTISTTANADVAALNSIAYFQNSSTPGLFYLDEVHVSISWADVTPVACTPGTRYNVTGGGVSCGGTPVNVGLSGSDAGIDYYLLANNLQVGLISGTGSALDFGAQTNSGGYTVYASNTVSGCTYWMNGSPAVLISTPPAIVSQPIDAAAVSGSTVTLSVTPSTGEFTYQWRKNGVGLTDGGNISGSSTPTLTISPATAADAAAAGSGYDVVISGTCPPAATSTRVALTIKPLSNLVWVGDGISNLWDVAVSTNWTDNGAPAVFNFGDNVKFDDSSLNPSVVLASSFLSPTTVTVSNELINYSFGGLGAIIGHSSIIKTGAGTMLVTNVNSFIGGSSISNGQVTLAANEANATTTGGQGAFGQQTNQITFYGAAPGSAILELFGYSGSTSPTYNSFRNPLNIPAGNYGELHIPPRGATASSLTGAGTLNLKVNYIRDDLTGNWSGFTGNINVSMRNGSGDQFRANNTNGYPNASIYENDGVALDNVSSANTVVIGELAGSSASFLGGGDSARPNTEFRVGGKNTSTNFDGIIRDGGTGTNTSITKVGTGTWTLTGANTYTGTTVVSNGVLSLSNGVSGDGSFYSSTNITVVAGAILDVSGRSDHTLPLFSGQTLKGSGTIRGSVDASLGGNVEPGPGIATLTVTNAITLGGTTTLELSRPNNDRIVAQQINYNGNLVVTNIGSKLQAGDTFQLFSGPVAGAFLSVILPTNDATGATYTWEDDTATTGSIKVLTATGGVATNSTNITTSVSGTNLTLTWPTDHTGWLLQAQTNSLTGPNWVTISGASSTNQFTVPIDPANKSVFFRLLLP
jgi:autotransporter-associated beta strand protein